MKKLNLQINKRIEFISEEGKISISLIQDIQENFMLITIPMIGVKPQIFHDQEELEGVYYEKDNVYVFTLKVLERVLDNIPLYKVTLPTNLKKIQRRDFVRIPISLPIYYMEINKELEDMLKNSKLEEIEKAFVNQWEKGYTMDLSGGGIRASVRKPIDIGKRVFFILQSPKMYLGLKGEILRCDATIVEKHTRYQLGIKYVDILEKEREQIIAFIFAEMRKLRKNR